MTEDWQNGGFGLYIHWPFCSAKCPYCDFNSYVADKIDENRWVRAYIMEIERTASLTQGRVLNSVFFGGGTPSLMSVSAIEQIITAVRANWSCANTIEITMEANPTSVEAGRFVGYKDAGVNRISVGIQSLNDDDLKRLGRLHTVREGIQAFELAAKTFEKCSFDLIYSRQNQTLIDWQSELKEALTIAAGHLSMYQLTIEPNTAFGDRYEKGLLKGLPTEDTEADMYFATQEIAANAGYMSYEVSNYAKSDHESAHNLIYWRYGDYIGIGPGAHGRVTLNGTRHATETELSPLNWLKSVEQNATGETTTVPLSREEQGTEFLLMGLRLSEGISPTRYNEILGLTLPEIAITHLADLGLITANEDTLAVTPKGRPLINGILRELLAD
ncbi:radical SAM family heme chaperone HemW [Nereida ignava]|uniref:radical SAM family heme chaperone HemW n=1 Tax=Nereida ignava TaxID=282199 RepID=UPI003F6AD597